MLWAAAIDGGNTAVYQTLLDIVYQRQEKGKVTANIISSLLLSEKEEAWKGVEALLLSAQREEGLRQTIVECLDETSLGAFLHLIKVILEKNLLRFSSVVRAIDVWAGLGWEAAKKSTVKRFLTLGYEYLQAPAAIPDAMASKDNAEVYMALWAQGVLDVTQCAPLVRTLYEKGTVEKRCLALYFVAQAGPQFSAYNIWEDALFSDTPKVFAWAVRLARMNQNYLFYQPKEERQRLFDRLTAKLVDIPKEKKVYQKFAFDWIEISIDKTEIFWVLISFTHFGEQAEVERLYPYFSQMEAYPREVMVGGILPNHKRYHTREGKELTMPLAPWQRQFALDHLKDRSASIQKILLAALSDAPLSDNDTQHLEALLTRKSSDLRRNTIQLLLKQNDEQVKRSTERLLAAKSVEQRLGGLDLLQQVQDNAAFSPWAGAQTKQYQARANHSKREVLLLENLATTPEEKAQQVVYTWENGLGLFDPKIKTPTVQPAPPTEQYLQLTKENRYGFSRPFAEIVRVRKDLLQLLEAYKNHSYEVIDWEGAQQSRIFGQGFWPLRPVTKENPLEGATIYNYPLAEVWIEWYKDSQLIPRDLYLMLLDNTPSYYYEDPFQEPLKTISTQLAQYLPRFEKDTPSDTWNFTRSTIIQLLSGLYPYQDQLAFVEGLVRQMINSLSAEQLAWSKKEEVYGRTRCYSWHHSPAFNTANNAYGQLHPTMTAEAFTRFWKIQYWIHQSNPNNRKHFLPIEYDAKAYQLGLLSKDELYQRVLQPDNIRYLTYYDMGWEKDKPELLVEYPFLEPLVEQCTARILEIELLRGDSPTVVSALAANIRALYGVDYLVAILHALGKETLHRGYSWRGGGENKKELLSTLLERLKPNKETDSTPFNKIIQEAGIEDKRLVEAALYAPQWLELVAEYLNWPGLKAAAWWLQAHTRDHNSEADKTKISHYTKVALEDFDQGAVDVQWFQSAYKTLGKARWKLLYNAAKYLSTGGQHKRAQLFADVILGTTKITAVMKRIKASRNQDYLRAYGLVPLSKKTPQKDLLKRYQFIQQFKKESKQFGSQKQNSEATAAKIALENLARTAGYDDPLRLTWAMESKTVQEILATAQPIELGDTRICLHIDAEGKAQLKVEKAGKFLANVPAKHRKNAQVQALRAQVNTLREQLRRARHSLEQAMVNGDPFRVDELMDLSQHPVVAPLLEQLVFESEGQLGFLREGSLLDAVGKTQPLGAVVRLAHPYDLYLANVWSAFQHQCFEQKIKQPFKQVFRNLYVPTADEKAERVRSRRYAGHQVQPKKTLALLKGRGWTVDYYEGVQKVFHKEQLLVQLYATANWFSPADVEAPTLEYIEVLNLQTRRRQPLDELPPRLFSEVMRDLDLVVSVAHVGGVDPEASQSTLEMRAVLVEETARLFKLDNVTLSQRHVHIDGQLGDYTVHLGSGVCHQLPGNYLSIVAVPSQHRGRIFLPFVDEDPRTAEVLSKVLMLAKDNQIQDPTILQQLEQGSLKG